MYVKVLLVVEEYLFSVSDFYDTGIMQLIELICTN